MKIAKNQKSNSSQQIKTKDTDILTIPQADIEQDINTNKCIVTVSCGKNKRGNPPWHDTFIGIINVNTFQELGPHGNSGYEIFNGFKNKDNFTIKVDGRYTNKSDSGITNFIKR